MLVVRESSKAEKQRGPQDVAGLNADQGANCLIKPLGSVALVGS